MAETFDTYGERARRALYFARYEASKRGSRIIESTHLLLGVMREDEERLAVVLEAFSAAAEKVRRALEGGPVIIGRIAGTAELPLSAECEEILGSALEEARQGRLREPGTEHLLLGILRHGTSAAARLLVEEGITLEAARRELERLGERPGEDGGDGDETSSGRRTASGLLHRLGRDLTAKADAGELDPLVGREEELARLIEVLARRTKNSPLLLGEPGVGKTALVEGLAQRIADGRVPVCLRERRLVALEISALVAGTRFRGQFEERLRQLLREVRDDGRVLLFVDEVHTLVGAGAGDSAIDAAHMLKPALARGELSLIGATTPAEYLQHIERDRALQRRFEPVRLEPPSLEETRHILDGLRDRYEGFHGVVYDDEALSAAVVQSDRYLAERQLPDKAIDVVDQAGARVKVRWEGAAEAGDGPPRVTRLDVETVVARVTGIPVARLRGDEAERLTGMEAALRRRVVGQDEAVSAVSRAVRRSRLGVADPQRPVGSFLFLGPPGVGKTEVARRLAEFLFGSEESLVRFDMSELMERHAVSRLIGAPPGYVGFESGGQLTEQVRRRPYSLILFDELEKAHPDVVNLLLQVMEDGVLTDAFGNRVDFRHALLILTSNVGSRELEIRTPGFGGEGADAERTRMREKVLGELKRSFSPELVDRLDEVVVFRPLGRPELLAVVDLLLEDLGVLLAGHGVRLSVTAGAREWLLDFASTDGSKGARSLRRTIQRQVHDRVSELLIRRLPEVPRMLEVDVDGDDLRLAEIGEAEVAPVDGTARRTR